MVSGSNDLPDLKIQATPVQPAAPRVSSGPAKPQRSEPKLIQAPDTVQLSLRAQAASRGQAAATSTPQERPATRVEEASTVAVAPEVAKLKAVAETTPEVRPSRVEEATAQIRAQAPNSSALNAQLAEKLLTEN